MLGGEGEGGLGVELNHDTLADRGHDLGYKLLCGALNAGCEEGGLVVGVQLVDGAQKVAGDLQAVGEQGCERTGVGVAGTQNGAGA